MADFDTAVIASRVNVALAGAGKQMLTKEAADLVLQVVAIESSVSPALLAFTMVYESGFNLKSKPNTNHKPQNPGYWDCGPWQLNQWWLRKLFKEQKRVVDEDKVFGSVFFNPDLTPCEFSGDPVWNGVAAAWMLASLKLPNVLTSHAAERNAAGRFTGGARADNRAEWWDKLGPSLHDFFNRYQGV